MSNLENLLNRLTIDITQEQEHYVHYDKETKRIHKISPVNQESKFEVCKIESEIVEPILNGTSRLDDYIVFFDYISKKMNVKKKQFEMFSNLIIEEILKAKNPDLEIFVDSKYITFKIKETLHEHIKNDESYLVFVVTEKHNPYKLYNSFNIKTSDLLRSNKIEHQLTIDQIKNRISMFTNMIFETYSLKVEL